MSVDEWYWSAIEIKGLRCVIAGGKVSFEKKKERKEERESRRSPRGLIRTRIAEIPKRRIHWHRFNSGQRIKRRRAVVWWL